MHTQSNVLPLDTSIFLPSTSIAHFFTLLCVNLLIIPLSYVDFNANTRIGFITFTLIIIVYLENCIIVYEPIEFGVE